MRSSNSQGLGHTKFANSLWNQFMRGKRSRMLHGPRSTLEPSISFRLVSQTPGPRRLGGIAILGYFKDSALPRDSTMRMRCAFRRTRWEYPFSNAVVNSVAPRHAFSYCHSLTIVSAQSKILLLLATAHSIGVTLPTRLSFVYRRAGAHAKSVSSWGIRDRSTQGCGGQT